MKCDSAEATRAIAFTASPFPGDWFLGLVLAATLGCGKSNAPASSGRSACESDAECLNGFTCFDKHCTPVASATGGSAGSSTTDRPASSVGGAGTPEVTATGAVGESSGGALATSTPASSGGASFASNHSGGATSLATQLGEAGAKPRPNQVGSATPVTSAQLEEISRAACNRLTVEPERGSAKLAIVLDLSSSMNHGAGSGTVWSVLRDALISAIANPSSLDAKTSVGLLFYPNLMNESVSTTPVDTSACVNVDAALPLRLLGTENSTARATLIDALLDAQLGRGTPTADAYEWALSNLLLTSEQQSSGAPHVLLVTDGPPTFYLGCYNPSGSLTNLSGDPIVELVTKASTLHAVRSYFVGLGGTEDDRPWLSKAAVAGGTRTIGCVAALPSKPCHIDLTTADLSASLDSALSSVFADLGRCRYVIPQNVLATPEPNFNPILTYGNATNEVLQRHTSTADVCVEGYRVIDGKELDLCPQTCDRVRANALTKITLVVGCEQELASTLR